MTEKQRTKTVANAVKFVTNNAYIYSNTAELELKRSKGSVAKTYINDVRKKVREKTMEAVKMASEMFEVKEEIILKILKIDE